MALIAGTRLGPYEILAPIGKGGMGEVYKATDTRLDRAVAVKLSIQLATVLALCAAGASAQLTSTPQLASSPHPGYPKQALERGITGPR